MKYQFIARCGEETMPLEVSLDYRPGKQGQRARRLAVGELLATLESIHATVDASVTDLVKVETDSGTWIIAEGGAITQGRGAV